MAADVPQRKSMDGLRIPFVGQIAQFGSDGHENRRS